MLTRMIISITDIIFGPPDPDSNEALRRWLWENPDKDLSAFPSQ